MPKPDLVLYLHVPSDVTEKLILSRVSGEVNQKTGIKNDIYEKDIRHQRRCKRLALSANWTLSMPTRWPSTNIRS